MVQRSFLIGRSEASVPLINRVSWKNFFTDTYILEIKSSQLLSYLLISDSDHVSAKIELFVKKVLRFHGQSVSLDVIL